jgi:hypothetical protein
MFAFGKHQGKTFQQVAESEPGYCKWALKQAEPGGALKDFVAFLRARNPDSAPQGAGLASVAMESKPHWMRGTVSGPEHGRPVKLNTSVEGFAFNGPRLDEETTLVMELISDDRFSVRAEKPHVASFSRGKHAAHSPPPQHKTAYVQPHIWQAIKSLGCCYDPGSTSGSQSFVFPRSKYDTVAECLTRIGNVERIPDWVLRLATGAASVKGDCPMEERLPDGLYPYQREGVSFGLARGGRCLIGDEMGLGKSLQALALAAQYAEEWPVLVLCPSSLRWVWKEQITEWLPEFVNDDEIQVIKKGTDQLRPDAKFWIISYNMFAANAKREHKGFQRRPDGSDHSVVIADESHWIKEWGAERTKAAVPVLQKAKRVFMLSGTPTRNSPEELHPQLAAIIPKFYVKALDFKARYCLQQQQNVFGGRVVNQVVGARNSHELNYLLTSSVMIRRQKKEVLHDLPPKRRQKIPLETSRSKQMEDMYNRLEHITDSWQPDDVQGVQTYFKKVAEAKLPAVKEYLLEVLDRTQEKAIVFAHHHLMMDSLSELLAKRLAKDGQYHICIDGRTSANKRADFVKDFQTEDECRIALLSITACGEGLSLTAAGLVIFAELYWVPGTVEQAEARAHRIGTKHNKVVVEFLVVPNSPEERIYDALERKKKDTSKVLDGSEESLGALERLTRKRAQELVDGRSLKFPEKTPKTMSSSNLEVEAMPSDQSSVPSVTISEKSQAAKKPRLMLDSKAEGRATSDDQSSASSVTISMKSPPGVIYKWTQVGIDNMAEKHLQALGLPAAGDVLADVAIRKLNLNRLKEKGYVDCEEVGIAAAESSPTCRRSGHMDVEPTPVKTSTPVSTACDTHGQAKQPETPAPVHRSKIDYLLRAAKG